MSQKQIDIAWASGLFEGKGCISIYRYERGRALPTIRLNVSATDRELVVRFVEAIDGDVDIIKERKAKGGIIYRYIINNRLEVERIIQLLLPYLSEGKAAKAIEALSLPPAIRTRS